MNNFGVRKSTIFLILLAIGLVAAACGGSAEESELSLTEPSVLAACPDPIVVQTDWFPEPEHGALYNLTGGKGSIDSETGRFSGPIEADPAVTLEIRAGGPFVGDQTTTALMATDDDILLGYVDTDIAIQNYDKFPTTAVVAPLDLNPTIIMYDPETYPITDWDEVEATEATIAHFATDLWVEYLVGARIVDRGQLDGSYDGSSARFVAEEGELMQQGFATQEPYNYENVFSQWGKPVASLMVHDAGYQNYAGPLAVLDSRLEQDGVRECLEAFVPIFQESIISYQQDPSVTNEAILTAVEDLDSFWELSEDSVQNSVKTMGQLGIVGNGNDKTVGDFDIDRVTELILLIQENVESVEVPERLEAEDLVTNEFIDESIGF